LRESMAALFLRQCGYSGTQVVVDPMCGSGTFVIEAAEIAAGLAPGRSRRFAFEDLAGFDAAAWDKMRAGAAVPQRIPAQRFYGSDRDAGAVRMATENAERAGVADWCSFTQMPFSDLVRPEGAPGLVMVNPPYGARIGNKKLLYGLYGALGGVLKDRFAGWRVGLVTSEPGLAKATGLPFDPPGPPVAHGGLKVKLYSCQLV
ncbi:MAG: class I SAM-dependent RNA methyltransferase, partial [Pseudodonghicola sp.]